MEDDDDDLKDIAPNIDEKQQRRILEDTHPTDTILLTA
jgi:hypothetical protein